MKRRAVSIIEFSIGIALLVLLASQIALSTNLSTQTPKREAEKLAKKLSSLVLKADKTHTAFEIHIDSQEANKMTVQWNTPTTSIMTQHDRDIYTEDFPASSGCTYSWWKSTSKLLYSPAKSTFTIAGTIAVKGKGDTYYVIVAAIGSRVRVSDVPPP